MTYTFRHAGTLMGDASMQKSPTNRWQRAGIFKPNAYGLELLPRLTCLLTASYELKQALVERGLPPDDLRQPEALELIETTSGGRKMIDVGRVLSKIEVRDPDGHPVRIASIAFSDIRELQSLTRLMKIDNQEILQVPAEESRYIVSFTRAVRVPWSRESSTRPVRPGRRRLQ
jgi:hypothetical protein